MYFPHTDTPNEGGPLTVADLDRAIAAGSTGRILCGQRVLLPHGCDQSGRYETRRWGQSGYGSDDIAPAPEQRVIPLTRLARWWLAFCRFWLG